MPVCLRAWSCTDAGSRPGAGVRDRPLYGGLGAGLFSIDSSMTSEDSALSKSFENLHEAETRNVWIISPNSELAIVFSKPELYREMNRGGINPKVLRAALLSHYPVDLPMLSLADREAVIVDSSLIVPDFMVWNWVPTLSESAQQIMLSLGVSPDEFIRCRIDLEGDRIRYLHLPAASIDCVDIRRSKFQMILNVPGFAEMPIGLQQLAVVDEFVLSPNLHATRVRVPNHDQVFAELVVDDLFKSKWSDAKLTGAKFLTLGRVPLMAGDESAG